MTPNVDLTITDGNVGPVAPSSDGVLAIISPATAGPLNAPKAYTRPNLIKSTHGSGPGVEHSGQHLNVSRKPVVFIRCGASVPGEYSDVDLIGAGTSVPAAGAGAPTDELDVVIEFTAGGTIEAAGAVYRVSVDGGVTFGAPTALGTDDEIAVGDGASVVLGAGTVVAGDRIVFRTIAPQPTTLELATALEALRAYGGAWEAVHLEAQGSSTFAAQLDLFVLGLQAAGKFKWWSCNTRRREAGETLSAYETALQGEFGGASSIYGLIGADYADTVGVFGKGAVPRPFVHHALARAMRVDIARDLAAVEDGALPGCGILDADLMPKHHDEQVYPGLDALRFCVARTVPGYEGAYVNNPRLFSPTGSDYRWLQHIRVILRAAEITHKELTRRLSVDVLTDPKTGFVLEQEAIEIEGSTRAQLRDALVQPRRASAADFDLARDDNVLSTDAMSGDVGVQFKGYPKTFRISVGARNPANAA